MIDVAGLKNKLAGHRPKTAIILGSGLGQVAAAIENSLTIPYAEIGGFPQSTVPGHKGCLIVGGIAEREVLCMQGRFHLYEGHDPRVIAEVIDCLKALGIEELLVTNAAGSLNPQLAPGELMLITDHINFSGRNPLVGPNDEAKGPRFPDMSNAYDREMREKMLAVAQKLQIRLQSGVYLMVLGPNFETAAEIRAFRVLGADAVGMSTVPEVIAAVHAGLKVAAVSAITNFGTGMQSDKLSHEETLANAQKASGNLTNLLIEYLREK